MACLGVFEDTVDPDQPILTLRKNARVFVINPQGRIGMIHVLGQDEFGLRDHLESCGGGIEARGEREPGCRPGSVGGTGRGADELDRTGLDRRRISSAPAA